MAEDETGAGQGTAGNQLLSGQDWPGRPMCWFASPVSPNSLDQSLAAGFQACGMDVSWLI